MLLLPVSLVTTECESRLETDIILSRCQDDLASVRAPCMNGNEIWSLSVGTFSWLDSFTFLCISEYELVKYLR
jgi:hypothetical protein